MWPENLLNLEFLFSKKKERSRKSLLLPVPKQLNDRDMLFFTVGISILAFMEIKLSYILLYWALSLNLVCPTPKILIHLYILSAQVWFEAGVWIYTPFIVYDVNQIFLYDLFAFFV